MGQHRALPGTVHSRLPSTPARRPPPAAPDDAAQQVVLAGAREQGQAQEELGGHAAQGPHVDGHGIGVAQDHLVSGGRGGRGRRCERACVRVRRLHMAVDITWACSSARFARCACTVAPQAHALQDTSVQPHPPLASGRSGTECTSRRCATQSTRCGRAGGQAVGWCRRWWVGVRRGSGRATASCHLQHTLVDSTTTHTHMSPTNAHTCTAACIYVPTYTSPTCQSR